MMQESLSTDVKLALAFDILSDMVLKYLSKLAGPELREATLAIAEKEMEDQLDFEMTCELLGTADFRIVA
jgi:hypothetical protein